MSAQVRCRNCRFYDGQDAGTCHRHSPRSNLPSEPYGPIWPTTYANLWCGDHEGGAYGQPKEVSAPCG